MADRQYLTVPFNERDAAKAAGARWDAKAKSWWASDRVRRERIERWLPERQQLQQPARISEDEARSQFADAMRDMGLKVSGQHPIMDGKPHRIPVGDDHGARESGRYVGYLDGHPAGHIKNYKTGADTNWKSDGAVKPPEDMAAARAEDAQRRQERDQARLQAFEATARRVSRQAERLTPLAAATPYMQAKGIEPSIGALTDRDGRTLYLPAGDVDGKQWTMQYIREDGSKRFAKDSRKEGSFHVVGGDMAVLSAAAVLIVAEGYATAKTVSDAAKAPTIVAFDSGNLSPVVEALHARFPDKPILIAADDDRRVELEKGFNPGRDKATDAAASVGGVAILPAFAPGEQESDLRGFTDFNDMAVRSRLGREEVEVQVAAGIAAATLARSIDRPEADIAIPTPAPAHVEGKTMTDNRAGGPEEPATDVPPVAPASAPMPSATPRAGPDAELPPAANENSIAPGPTIARPNRETEQTASAKPAPGEASPSGPAEPVREATTSGANTPEADKPRERSTDVGDVPEDIAKRYFVQKSRWSGEPSYHETATSTEPAFRDQGAKIIAANNSPAVARDLVAIAEHRGWQPVQVAGADTFKREIWLAASERGLEVRGYKPNERDLQELTRRAEARSDRQGNSIAPAETGGAARQATARADSVRDPGTGARETTFETGIQGKLVGFGEAVFDEKKGGKPTPYADLELPDGSAKRAWGVGLPDAIQASGKVVGDAVVVQRLGREQVQVQVSVVDPETKIRSMEERTVERNKWVVSGVDRKDDRSPAPRAEEPRPVAASSTATRNAEAPVSTKAPVEQPGPREYLAVPYKDRDAAKEAGARWDAQAKSWYAGETATPGALARWQVRDQGDERTAKLIGSDRTARAQMRVIETVVAKSLGDNPEAAARLLKEARSTLAQNVEQGREANPPRVRDGQGRSPEPTRPVPRPPVDRSPPPPTPQPQRAPPERSRGR